MGQFITWAKKHVAGQAPKLTNTDGDVALRHVEGYTVDQYLAFLDKAVNDDKSVAASGFYNYLLTLFVEADEECQGKINYTDFTRLVDIAAKTPRFFKLAPDSQDEAARREMFQAMDSSGSGYITFRKFLHFVRNHVRAKVAERGISSASATSSETPEPQKTPAAESTTPEEPKETPKETPKTESSESKKSESKISESLLDRIFGFFKR
jgi:hypothetical protein